MDPPAPQTSTTVERNRRTLVAFLIGTELLLVGGILFWGEWSRHAVLEAVRTSARWSAVVFSFAFAAPGLSVLFRNRTRWIWENPRSLILSFCASHFIHLATLGIRAVTERRAFFEELILGPLVGGAILYALIAHLAFFWRSDPAPPDPYRRKLTKVTMVLLWIAFTLAYVSRLGSNPIPASIALLLVLAFALRVFGQRTRDSSRT